MFYAGWSSPNIHGWHHLKSSASLFPPRIWAWLSWCPVYLTSAVRLDRTRPSEGNAELLVLRVGRGGARLVPGAIVRIEVQERHFFLVPRTQQHDT
jgi:hypothetical protein